MSGKAPTTLHFLEFTLDAANARLWRGSEVIDLRPKTLAVLGFLIGRPAQLVTKREILEAVWADTAVTEWVLTSCVKELRQALGDDPRQPRIIETAHGRGYRFIAAVASAGAGATLPQPSRQVTIPGIALLVGRDAELAELNGWLAAALDGRRQIGFVAGEPGIGKTALVSAFANSLPGIVDGLWVAHGQCVEMHGAAEPYLPVLEAMGRLCRAPENESLVALLRRHAPSWLLQLPGIVDPDEVEQIMRRLGDGSRQRMLREMAALVEALPQPLVLVLEDLHWSDQATLQLVSRLAQGREAARLLLLATYRPVDVAVQEHPLKMVHHELRLHGRCLDLWLQPLGEAAVSSYLRARFGELDGLSLLAHTVHQRTDGNPLFLVNVANALLTDEVVVAAPQGFQLRADVGVAGIAVPLGLRQMIAARLNQLSDLDRDVLAAGSLVGRTFSAASVAAAVERDVVVVEERLSRLAERGQIVEAVGETTWPDSTVAGAYRFLHSLYQTVIRERVSAALRQRLHWRLAERLEAAYPSGHTDIAAELAHHFEAGGQPDRAVPNLEVAAERALRMGAGREAVALLRRGIALLDAAGPTRERARLLSLLCIELGRALPSVEGYVQPEIEAAYRRARALAEEADNPGVLLQALGGLASMSIATGKFDQAEEAARGVSRIRDALPFPGAAFAHHTFNGLVRYHIGPLTEAAEHLEAAAAMDKLVLPATSIDARVAVYAYLAATLLHRGFPEQSRQRIRQAEERIIATGRSFDRANLRQMECVLALIRRDHPVLARVATEARAVGREHEITSSTAVGEFGLGVCRSGAGDPGCRSDGLKMMRAAIDRYRGGGHLGTLPFLLGTFAAELVNAGDLDAAAQAVAESKALVASTREQRIEAELIRIEGLIHLHRGDQTAAEGALRHAAETARRQGARWWELRATASWVEVMTQSARPAKQRRAASELLVGLLATFDEGHDTIDIQEAQRIATAARR